MDEMRDAFRELDKIYESYQPVIITNRKERNDASRAFWAARKGSHPYIDWENFHKAFDWDIKNRTNDAGEKLIDIFADDGTIKPGIDYQYIKGFENPALDTDFTIMAVSAVNSKRAANYDTKADALAKAEADKIAAEKAEKERLEQKEKLRQENEAKANAKCEKIQKLFPAGLAEFYKNIKPESIKKFKDMFNTVPALNMFSFTCKVEEYKYPREITYGVEQDLILSVAGKKIKLPHLNLETETVLTANDQEVIKLIAEQLMKALDEMLNIYYPKVMSRTLENIVIENGHGDLLNNFDNIYYLVPDFNGKEVLYGITKKLGKCTYFEPKRPFDPELKMFNLDDGPDFAKGELVGASYKRDLSNKFYLDTYEFICYNSSIPKDVLQRIGVAFKELRGGGDGLTIKFKEPTDVALACGLDKAEAHSYNEELFFD